MVQKYQQGKRINYQFDKWISDDESELHSVNAKMGDCIYVIHTGETWIMDSKGKWYPKNGDKDPIACDCVEELTIWGEIPG